MARKKKSDTAVTEEPMVIKGSHTTVTQYPDGRTEMVTDWYALQQDVARAIESWEAVTADQSTEKRRTKKR